MTQKTFFFVIITCFQVLFLSGQLSPCAGFGKNKVQYTPLHWTAIESPHFTTYLHQNCTPTISTVAPSWVEKAYFALQSQFRFTHRNRIPLIIYGNTNLFTQTNIITELLPEEVGGFTELFKNRIVVPFDGSYKDFRHVLHHELVHEFFFGMFTDQFGNSLLTSGGVQLPLWFNEGAAEFLSSGWDTEADMFMIDRTLNSYIPPPGPELDGYMAYKGGQSFLFFLSSSRSDSMFNKFLVEFKKSKSLDVSIKKIYHTTLGDLGKEWIRELRRLYWPEIGCRDNPEKIAKALTGEPESRDFYNLRPRISPDGKHIAYFSDHYDYTRIVISDQKGKICQSIGQSGYGGFFEAFHPFRSGLCWSPDGKSIAFVTNSSGSDEIRIVDIKREKLLHRIRTRLNSISSPDWSKDGTTLVFTAVDSGRCDLYLYSIDKDSLSQLTHDLKCESDPRISPDGKYIMYAVEETGTGDPTPSKTPWGAFPTELAKLSLENGESTVLSSTPWSEKQPCFSPDGNRILFVSNRNGIDNLYIAPSDSIDRARPLTNFTGSSITPDWSRGSDHIAFTLFQKQGWNVWTIQDPLSKVMTDTLLPTRWVASHQDSNGIFFNKAQIPPDTSDSTRHHGKHHRISSDHSDSAHTVTSDSLSHGISPDTAAPDTAIAPETNSLAAAGKEPDSSALHKDSSDTVTYHDFTDTMHLKEAGPYRLSFTPDMVSVGVGMGTAYSPAGQMIVALSDLMGDQRITFAGDLQGNLSDYAHIFLSYIFLKHRIDFGGGGFYSKDYALASVFGDKIYHELQFGGFGIAQYPFSMFSRLELEGYASHIEQEVLDSQDPAIISNTTQFSLSHVYDNILWGITGPLNGLRTEATVQLSPSLPFVTEPYIALECDLRHYAHLFKRFVWANRLFLGASVSLSGGESARRYLLGGNENWFLYRLNIDEYEKNIPYSLYSNFVTPFRGWNYVDLWGTKAAVFNTEFRFPFIRDITVVWPLPIQVQYINGAVFADVGNAWDREGRSFTVHAPHEIYGGYGFGMRANLGIFILRFDRGWPTDWKNDVGTPLNYFSLGAEF